MALSLATALRGTASEEYGPAQLRADLLAGVGGQTLRALARAGWRNRKGRLRIFESFESALERAREHVLTAAGSR